MNSITINIKQQSIKNKIEDFLKTFNEDEIEVIIDENIVDLNLIIDSRGEETIDLEYFIANEN